MREFHDLGGVHWLLHLSSYLCLWGGASVPGSSPPLIGKMRWGLSVTYRKTSSWALTPLGRSFLIGSEHSREGEKGNCFPKLGAMQISS